MELETFDWLRSPDGLRLVEQAGEVYADADGDPVRAATEVRRLGADAERSAAALTQVQLRVKGVAKFGPDALKMWFTPDALEQATRARVAQHRAGRLAAATPASVIDLGCSIGGDLIAFARAGLTAAGVDLDPMRVAMAESNLAALELDGATMVADATELDLGPFEVAFADPARRSGRGRSFNVDDWAPSWEFVTTLLQRSAVVKVAPGIDHDLIPPQVEAEWVSDGGEVKEAALWAGPLATCGRRATVIADSGLASITEEDDPFQGRERPVREVGDYLFEPDGAVIRAGLVTAIAAGVDGGLIDEHIAWVTGDTAFRSPFVRGYRVLEEVPYREKGLRTALRARNIGALTIKTRGVDVTPERLRQRLALKGSESATLVLTRVAGRGTALLVDPL